MLAAKDTEIAGLRSHITDALALVPSSMYGDQQLGMCEYEVVLTRYKLRSKYMYGVCMEFVARPFVRPMGFEGRGGIYRYAPLDLTNENDSK